MAFSPFASVLGFTPMPTDYFVFLAGVMLVYLLIEQAANGPPFPSGGTSRVRKSWREISGVTQ